VHPGTQLHGRQGLLQVIGQLQGVEPPAPPGSAMSCRRASPTTTQRTWRPSASPARWPGRACAC
jgi:hypothetical protein